MSKPKFNTNQNNVQQQQMGTIMPYGNFRAKLIARCLLFALILIGLTFIPFGESVPTFIVNVLHMVSIAIATIFIINAGANVFRGFECRKLAKQLAEKHQFEDITVVRQAVNQAYWFLKMPAEHNCEYVMMKDETIFHNKTGFVVKTKKNKDGTVKVNEDGTVNRYVTKAVYKYHRVFAEATKVFEKQMRIKPVQK